MDSIVAKRSSISAPGYDLIKETPKKKGEKNKIVKQRNRILFF